MVFPLTGTAANSLNWLDNTNAVNFGTVSAEGWNWVMQFCNSNSQIVDAPHEFSIYDARDFNGWFRSLRPDVVLLPATASHTPVIQRFEATGRVRFGVPDAGTKAVILGYGRIGHANSSWRARPATCWASTTAAAS